MKVIEANGLDGRALNALLRENKEGCIVKGCLGQRFLAAGMEQGVFEMEGIPGNALGSYLNGATVVVRGNAQDAVGDTMNDGEIVVHGSIGDAVGYAMRGGGIFVERDAGYRAGIHMKEFEEKVPSLVIGGVAGSFLGEYQAGGIIIVLGIGAHGRRIVGDFPCAGMHGGEMYLRGACEGVTFPEQVSARAVGKDELDRIEGLVREFCDRFGYDEGFLLEGPFVKVVPNTNNPYRQMYVGN